MDKTKAEKIAQRHLEEWHQAHGGPMLELSASRDGRTHWVFGVSAVPAGLAGQYPQNVAVDKSTGVATTLGFFAMQAAFEILSVDEVRRHLKPEELAFLEGFLG